jgi:hypothetical protein
MSLIRGVLLAGRIRTHRELNTMSKDDRRNTLIVELAARTNQPVPHFQAMDDFTLAGVGAVYFYLLIARIRTEAQLRTMSDADQRNTLIVELNAQTHRGASLQALNNIELVLVGFGKLDHRDLEQPSYIRGVLVAGNFRTQHELNTMSWEDQRNTLIVELTNRTNQNNYQAFNNWDLAAAGAILVFLRQGRIRTDAELKQMSVNDMRNTLIVELDGFTHLGNRLQGLFNMQLVQLGLGVEQPVIFKRPIPFGVGAAQIHFKSLIPITDAIDSYLTVQFESMYELFIVGNVYVALASIEDLSNDTSLQPLRNLNVGACISGQPTQDQNALFQNRNNAGANDIVVYIVNTLIGGNGNFLGCASHPNGQPGCAIVQSTANWLLAHEVGHVLGLSHVCEGQGCRPGQSDSLMFPNVGWTNIPPDLSANEYQTMINSNLTPP